jgi:hypothetical protein
MQVIICILSLGKQAHHIPGYTGPCLGAREEKDPHSGSLRSPPPSGGRPSSFNANQFNSATESGKKTYKWDVKPGGSYVPQVPSQVQRAAQERDREQHTHQRKWEVKFAPQLATASRRTFVVSSDVRDFMDQFNSDSQLRTAMGGQNQERKRTGMPAKSAPHSPDLAGLQNRSYEDPAATGEYEEEYEEEDEEYEDDEQADLATAYRGIPPAGVVEGLMMMLTSPDPTEKAKAAAALCNICSETDSNRELVVQAGGLPSLIDMLVHP